MVDTHFPPPKAWIFVSHASVDLINVRLVRNYLEEKGAAPLLFHLMSLSDPKEFWPIVERELRARNFFLYCESAAAVSSPWVKREREVIEALRQKEDKRVGQIRVDQTPIDKRALDKFLAKTRVFPSYSWEDRDAIEPFLAELRGDGFSVFGARKIEGMLTSGENFQNKIDQELILTAADGWVVAFLSARSLQKKAVQLEIKRAQELGASIVPVLLEPLPLSQLASLGDTIPFDAFSSPATAPRDLAHLLLHR